MMRTFWTWAAVLVAGFATLALGPAWWSGRQAQDFLTPQSSRIRGLARSVAATNGADALDAHFATGSARFDGEWVFGTYMMSAMGLGQLAHADPEMRDWAAAQMLPALDRLTTSGAAFDTAAWGEAALDSLDANRGHAAYLGYMNLALSLHVSLDADSPYSELNRRISAALERRLLTSDRFVLETYPGEIYPVDNMAVVASIALADHARKQPRRAVVRRWLAHAARHFQKADSRLLFQSMAADGVTPGDGERGSGTALAAYFASFMSPELSAELFRALQTQLYDQVLGYGVIREYPWGQFGRGDIDSGPLVLGYSISATGFAMGAARANGAPKSLDRLLRTFVLFGAPLERSGQSSFVSGGPLGNAIVLAMLTALPASHWSQP